MKAYVFTDGALTRHARRFVWLSMDTEREESAAFVERFPIEAWPTLMVIDPKSEAVAVRWLGSMTVPQLERMLLDGESAVVGGVDPLAAQLAAADRAYGAGDHAQATALLDGLRRSAPKDWASRGRVVETLLMSRSQQDAHAPCFTEALEELQVLEKNASWANVAALGLGCGLELPAEHPGRKEGLATLEAAVREVLASSIPMAADDRSGLYAVLLSAREDDEAAAKAIATEWSAFLEAEAAKAKTPQQRTVFDSHRLTAYLQLGQADRAVTMLEQSERELPDDYNPPHRLTVALRELGRLPEALAANDRALKRAYGPRKVRVFLERANVFKAMGDVPAAKKAIEEGAAYVKTLPVPQQAPWMTRALEKALAGLQ